MKKNLSNQRGWTTMEYVIGAILIITIVTTVVGLVSEGLSEKGKKVKDEIMK